MADTPKQKIARLTDRGVVAVTGPDAGKLLQGLITNDMALLERQPAIFAGLLSPQGKILFEFFVVKAGDGFLLDVARERDDELVKRLTLYKLRAAVEIRNRSADYAVFVSWDGAPSMGVDGIVYPDPRVTALGARWLVPGPQEHLIKTNATATDYHRHRIGLGLPEGGKDYAFASIYPHVADFDQLHGVSFSKGCYVGQEIVARMQHKSAIKERVVPVTGGGELHAGVAIMAGTDLLGTMMSTDGRNGMALIRLDRVGEALAAGKPIVAGDVAVTIERPNWATFEVPGQGTPS